MSDRPYSSSNGHFRRTTARVATSGTATHTQDMTPYVQQQLLYRQPYNYVGTSPRGVYPPQAVRPINVHHLAPSPSFSAPLRYPQMGSPQAIPRSHGPSQNRPWPAEQYYQPTYPHPQSLQSPPTQDPSGWDRWGPSGFPNDALPNEFGNQEKRNSVPGGYYSSILPQSNRPVIAHPLHEHHSMSVANKSGPVLQRRAVDNTDSTPKSSLINHDSHDDNHALDNQQNRRYHHQQHRTKSKAELLSDDKMNPNVSASSNRHLTPMDCTATVDKGYMSVNRSLVDHLDQMSIQDRDRNESNLDTVSETQVSQGSPLDNSSHSKQQYVQRNRAEHNKKLRRREEEVLETEYDNGDGSTEADIDHPLFPTDTIEIKHIRHSKKYESSIMPNPASAALKHQTRNESTHLIRPNYPQQQQQPAHTHMSECPPVPAQLDIIAAQHSRDLNIISSGSSSAQFNSSDGFDTPEPQMQRRESLVPSPNPNYSPRNFKSRQPINSHDARQYPPQKPTHYLIPPPPPFPPTGSPGLQHVYNHNASSSQDIVSTNSHTSSSDYPSTPDPSSSYKQHQGSTPSYTGSSNSLPSAHLPQFGDKDKSPSSGSSSAVGMSAMVVPPLARVMPSNSPTKPPPPTMSSLEAYRTTIKRSKDPAAQLEFAKYVLEHADGIASQEQNPKLCKKRYDQLSTEGLKWIKKLAGSGITVHRSNIAAESQFFLGTVYSQGLYGVERDDSKAFAYYQQASKAQHAEANYRTAVCYEVGVGTRRDAARALQFYRKAAASSNVPAMYKLGVILIKGMLGVTPAPREGITWLKRGAENATPECPHPLHELALCHETSDIPGVLQDEKYARELYIKAGKLGYVPSQVKLGQAYEYGTLGCPIDPRKSIGWYTRAAEKRDPDAELALSGWYLTGADPYLPQNDTEAYLWARRAAETGLAKAEYAVGYYIECGIGVSHQDISEARSWYIKAAQKGNRRAIHRLEELKRMGVQGVTPKQLARPRRSKGTAPDDSCKPM